MKILILISTFIFLLSGNVLSQTKQITVVQPTTIEIKRTTVPAWLMAKETSIRHVMIYVRPGGAVFLPEFDVEKQYKFNPSSLVITDVLNAVIETEPQYRWEVKDGVINLLPSSKYPDLLDTVIPDFKLNNVTTWEALDAVEALPAFQQQATAHGYSNYIIPRLIAEDRLGGSKKLSVQCANKTVREILNSIVQADGKAVWSFREYRQKENKYFEIYLILS